METKEKYEKILREESTQLIFKDFNFINEIEVPSSLTQLKPKNDSVKIVKKELVRDNSSSISSSNLINKNNLNIKNTLKPSSSTLGIGSLSSDLNKYKVEVKSPGLIDSRLMKFKKTSNSLSTSSLLKQYKQMSNLSNSGNSIVGSGSGSGGSNGSGQGSGGLSSTGSSTNLYQHKRTGSSTASSKAVSNNFK